MFWGLRGRELGGVLLVFVMTATGLLGCSQNVQAQNLKFEQFLDQVKGQNQGYQGSKLRADGARDRIGEADLMTSPQVFWNSQWAMDEAQKMNPAAQGSKAFYQNHQLGLSQQTGFGVAAKLYYNLNYTSLTGTNAAFVPLPSVYEGKPVLELSIPLWRNLLGVETRGNRDALQAQTEAMQFSESFTSRVILAEAEGAYWRLALAKQNKKLQTESLDQQKFVIGHHAGLEMVSEIAQTFYKQKVV